MVEARNVSFGDFAETLVRLPLPNFVISDSCDGDNESVL